MNVGLKQRSLDRIGVNARRERASPPNGAITVMHLSFSRAVVGALIGLCASLALLGLAAGPAAADEPPAEQEVESVGLDVRWMLLLLEQHAEEVASSEGAAIGRAEVIEREACEDRARGQSVPSVIAEIFRCRVLEAGLGEEEAERVVAEAVVVARCESEWKADAVVFDGRYRDRPHPWTGSRYTAAGVFQFIRKTADDWIDGGYGQVLNGRRNIDAAARLYLHNRAEGLRGWEDWACAAANDGFKVGSVLPGWPGGPAELPDWAFDY